MPTSSAVAAESREEPDSALIEQVLAGQTAPFELLMRRYNERVYRAARSIVRDEQETEDVMPQAYVNAFTHLRQFNGSVETFTADGPISYWNSYVGVGQMGGKGTFNDPRIGLFINQTPDRVTPKLAALLDFQLSLERLRQTTDDWWEEHATFFDVRRSRAWVMTRRLTHTSHHRGQQMAIR